MQAGSLEIVMSANIARLAADMNQAKTMVGSSMKSIEGAVGSAKAALAGLGIALSAGYFVSLIKGSIDAMDHLHDLSKSTNIAVESLAGLKLAAKQSGGDLDSIGASINKLSVNMGKDADKFKALGVSAKDPLEAFKQLSDVFVAIQDPQLKAAVAAQALGKSWAGAAPLLAEGGRKIQEMVDKGKALSGVTKEATDRADEFNDKLAELAAASEGAKIALASDLLPYLSRVVDEFARGKREGGLFEGVLRGIGAAVSETDQRRNNKEFADATEKFLEAQQKFAGAQASGQSLTWIGKKLKAQLDEAEAVLKTQQAYRDLLEQQKMQAEWDKEMAKRRSAPSDKEAKAATDRGKAFVAEKTSAQDTDSAYRSLKKTLDEKLLVDRERTEVAKLLLDLEALSAKKRAEITPDQVAELKRLAAKVDLQKREKAALDAYLEGRKQLADIDQEIAVARAAEDDKRAEAIISTEKVIEQIKFETTLINLSNAEREKAIALRTMETSGINKQSLEYEKLGERLKEALASREATQAAKDLKAKSLEEFNSLWSTVESTGKQAFIHVFGEGKSAFEGIGKAIKASVIDLLYQLTAKKWIINIGTSVAGSLGMSTAGTALAGDSGLGGLGNMLSLGNSAFGGSLFSGAGAYAAAVPGLTSAAAGSQAAMLAAQTGAFGAEGLALTSAAGGSAIAGGAAAAMAAIPVWGWAALAAAAIFAMDSGGGGPKTGDIQLQRQNVLNWKDTSATSTGRSFVVGNNNLAGDQTQNEALLHALIPILNDATKYDPNALDKLVGMTISGSDVNQGIAQLMAALEPAAKATAAMAQAERDLENARISALDKAVGVLRTSYQREAADLEAMAAKWHAAAEGLRAYGASLIGIGSGGISYAAAARQFAITAAQARAGDMGAMGNLQGVSETFRTSSLAGSRTSLDYARDVARIRAAVGDAASVAETRESVALQQRDLLTTQVEQLIDIKDAVVSTADAMVALQGQVDQLRSTTDSSGKQSKRVADILDAVAHGQLTLSTEAV